MRIRSFMLVLSILLPIGAAAQTILPQGHLERSHGHLELDGDDLTIEEQQLLLSDICGYDYNASWDRYNGYRKMFLAETIVGGVACGVGATSFLCNYAMVISLSIFAGINGVDDAWKQERLRQARIGGYVFLAGIPLLGTGIPLMQLQKRRLDEIVDYYNGDEYPDEPPHAQLTFGPTANGVGFALKF